MPAQPSRGSKSLGMIVVYWVVVVFFVGVAAFGLIGAVVTVVGNKVESATTTGTVTSTQDVCSIEYKVDRQLYYDDEQGGRGGCTMHVGQRVTVHYDPHHPSDASTNHGLGYLLTAFFLLIVGLLGLAGVVACGRAAVRSSRDWWTARH